MVAGRRPGDDRRPRVCVPCGEEGPQTFSEIGFDVDGIKYKIREDFGAGWCEPRGWYLNPGQ